MNSIFSVLWLLCVCVVEITMGGLLVVFHLEQTGLELKLLIVNFELDQTTAH